MIQTLTVPLEKAGMRIDVFLTEACDMSRSYVQKLLKSQSVTVNGRTVKASYQTVPMDDVRVEAPDGVEPEIEAELMDLDILYEDEDVILINKPKGMVVHPAAGRPAGGTFWGRQKAGA